MFAYLRQPTLLQERIIRINFIRVHPPALPNHMSKNMILMLIFHPVQYPLLCGALETSNCLRNVDVLETVLALEVFDI